MLIATLGSIGLGLVWGWMLGMLGGRHRASDRRWPVRNVLILGAASLLLAAQVFLLANWQALALFGGAAAVALLFHLGWLRHLRARYEVSSGSE
jgi:peptidoglycan/LPS O-acetylase OafA/YrhL